jgi:hypothetical protein
MPLQDHWKRVNTPLREVGSRERRIVLIGGGALAIACVVLLFVAISSSKPSPGPGCIEVDLPSTMGAVSNQPCGEEARQFCNSPAVDRPPLDETVLPRCREAGLR